MPSQAKITFSDGDGHCPPYRSLPERLAMGRQQQHQTKTTNSQAATSPALQKSTVDSISEFQEIFGSRAASRQFRSQGPDAQSLASPLSGKLGMPTIQAKPSFRGLSSELTASTASTIQPKLTIGEPGDKYEQEADRVAQDVVQRINSPEIATRDDGEEKKIQREPAVPIYQRVTATTGTLPNLQADFETELNQARGGGEPLDKAFRAKIEPAMNADFSGVRVHTDSQADLLNQSIQAKAFTTGQDVFFQQGAYQPESQKGQELLAHELTHVIQQNGSTVQRSPQVQEKNQSSPKSGEKVSQVGLQSSNIIQAMPKEKGREQFNIFTSKKDLRSLKSMIEDFEQWLKDIQKAANVSQKELDDNPYLLLKTTKDIQGKINEFQKYAEDNDLKGKAIEKKKKAKDDKKTKSFKIQIIGNTLLFNDSNHNFFGGASTPNKTQLLKFSDLTHYYPNVFDDESKYQNITRWIVIYRDVPNRYLDYNKRKFSYGRI
jgi:Domain of unknown function (DUF4157)